MRRLRKIKLRYRKERVVFSDVLPYELPIIFSNRYFYRFLVKNKISVQGIAGGKECKVICDNRTPDGARYIMNLLLNNKDLSKSNESTGMNKIKRIPFVYSIQHKPSKSRRLSIIHPINQIKVVEFYNKYKDAIIYLCSKSSFSIRKPQKVASYFFYRDRLHHTLLGRKTDTMEMYFSEYENLKTFFSYKEYTNIYKFYEDYRYQRAEKKFQHLLRMDVQSCFDSIYTHSIAWAVNGGVDIYKDSFRTNDKSIGCVWDEMMQEMNYNETNGIVIGPEFSRLFAEVILQQIDKCVEQELLKDGFRNKVDYECYRYVDDYFFFYNEETVKGKAIQFLQDNLKEYKLNLSQEKMEILDRPFITKITKAKIEIDNLINEYIRLHKTQERPESDVLENGEKEDLDVNEEEEDATIIVNESKVKECMEVNAYFRLKATDFNKKFKAILDNNEVASKDVLNYAIARMSIKLENSLKAFDKIYKPLSLALEDNRLRSLHNRVENKRKQMERNFAQYLYEVLDSMFFIYSSNKRINTTLKAMQLLNTVIIYVDNDYTVQKVEKPVKRFTEYGREMVFKKICDEIGLMLRTTPIDDRMQLETLYFLITLRSMNTKYRIGAEEIKKYLNIVKQKDDSLKFPHLNAIAILILLYYMGNAKEYDEIKKALMRYILERYDEVPEGRRKIMSEFAILTLDLATCPYVESEIKSQCLKNMGLDEVEIKEVCKYLNKQKYMFTKWTGLNVTKEINAKISQEVYS